MKIKCLYGKKTQNKIFTLWTLGCIAIDPQHKFSCLHLKLIFIYLFSTEATAAEHRHSFNSLPSMRWIFFFSLKQKTLIQMLQHWTWLRTAQPSGAPQQQRLQRRLPRSHRLSRSAVPHTPALWWVNVRLWPRLRRKYGGKTRPRPLQMQLLSVCVSAENRKRKWLSATVTF